MSTHFERAARLAGGDRDDVAVAQVHATLALVEAVRGLRMERCDECGSLTPSSGAHFDGTEFLCAPAGGAA